MRKYLGSLCVTEREVVFVRGVCVRLLAQCRCWRHRRSDVSDEKAQVWVVMILLQLDRAIRVQTPLV